MKVEHVVCGRDRRDPGTPVSAEARMLVFRLQSEGFVLELREDNGSVLVTPGQDVTAEDRAQLTARFHEIRDLLLTERPA